MTRFLYRAMRTRVKICCIASTMAIAAGAEALGLVSDAAIAEIAAFAPPPVRAVLFGSDMITRRLPGAA